MIEYRVKWTQCPTNYHDPRILYVSAANEDDAKTIARDHIERTMGIEWFKIEVMGIVQAMPPGKIL